MSSTKTHFTTPVDVRFADTDANGHVFFANYFTYFEIAFYQYLEAIGCSFEWFIKNGMNLYYVGLPEQITKLDRPGFFQASNVVKCCLTSRQMWFSLFEKQTQKNGPKPFLQIHHQKA